MKSINLEAKDYIFPAEAKSKRENKEIIKAIHASQHTQRNYDLSRTTPIEDIKTIITAATQCPSKQNIAFYDLHVIVNQKVIKSIYETTTNIHDSTGEYNSLSNPQILSNMLLVFSQKSTLISGKHKEVDEASYSSEARRIVDNDTHVAVGIAAGYVNLTASLLGLETGCCSCVMNYEAIKEMLQIDSNPLLLMGVGYKNSGTNRRMHPLRGTEEHKNNNWVEKFKTFKKESIKISYIK